VHTGCLETAKFSENINTVSCEVSRVHVYVNSSKLFAFVLETAEHLARAREFSSETLRKLFGASSDILAHQRASFVRQKSLDRIHGFNKTGISRDVCFRNERETFTPHARQTQHSLVSMIEV